MACHHRLLTELQESVCFDSVPAVPIPLPPWRRPGGDLGPMTPSTGTPNRGKLDILGSYSLICHLKSSFLSVGCGGLLWLSQKAIALTVFTS